MPADQADLPGNDLRSAAADCVKHKTDLKVKQI